MRFRVTNSVCSRLGVALVLVAVGCDLPNQDSVETMTSATTGPSEEADETGSPTAALQLHTWWQTAGDAAALEALTAFFLDKQLEVTVQVVSVTGGPIGSLFDLFARVATNTLPDVFLLMSPEVGTWTGYTVPENPAPPVNLLVPLDDLMIETGAAEQTPPELLDLNRVDGTMYAAPIGIHRHNTLFYNKSLLSDVGVEVPRSLADFESLCAAVDAYNAARPTKDRVFALANVVDGFALDTVFQSVLAASANELSPDSGGQYITDFFDGRKSVDDPEFQNAARFMNTVFRCSNQPDAITKHVCAGGSTEGSPCSTDADCGDGAACAVGYCGGNEAGTICSTDAECSGDGTTCVFQYAEDYSFIWADAARLVSDDRAVTFLHGDWVKGEYDASGFMDYGMIPAFGTDDTYIFSLINLGVFVHDDSSRTRVAKEFIRGALSAEGQARVAAVKGAVPARIDASLDLLDLLGQQTATEFRSASALQDTETIRGWKIWDPIIELWRARHRDGFASSGPQWEADIEAFTVSVAWAYEQFQHNPTGAF